MTAGLVAASICAILGWEFGQFLDRRWRKWRNPYDEDVVCENTRPEVYVYCDYNADDVRIFYEIPSTIAEIVRDQDPEGTFVEALAKLVHPYGEEGL